jgi:lactate permease
MEFVDMGTGCPPAPPGARAIFEDFDDSLMIRDASPEPLGMTRSSILFRTAYTPLSTPTADRPVYSLVALLPILLALLLLVGLRWPASRAMPVCALATVGLATLVWRVAPARVGAALVEALGITLGILLIVFGALFLLAVMRRGGALRALEESLGRVTRDRRLQAVLVAWVLGSFLEGAAGFGTPAAITAPLLIGLGFPPLAAVACALIGDSTAVSFGALGTPIAIGMEQGLAGITGPGAPGALAIAQRIALMDVAVGALMPLVLVLSITVGFGGRDGWRRGLAAAPFALAVGLAHMLTAALVASTLGPEFPSLLGPLVAAAVALWAARPGRLAPREPWEFPSSAEPSAPRLPPAPSPPLARALAPYGLLAGLLALTRVRGLGLGQWLASVEVRLEDVLGTGITARLQPLHSPGVFLALSALAAAALLGLAWRSGVRESAAEALRVTGRTALALLAAVALVRVFIHSGVNATGLPSMPLLLASTASESLGSLWPLAAPWVGALGSFIAGSATFSNMLFASLQSSVATQTGFDALTVLALQGMGAAAGNMVCVHNVVAACAVAGLLSSEGQVLRRTAPPMLVYVLLAGLLGLALGALGPAG